MNRGDRHAVVIIGVGELRHNRSRDPREAREPLDLMVDATERAAADAGLTAAHLAALDVVDVVQVVSWRYADPAAALAQRLGAGGAAATTSGVGGHQPVARLAASADRLARGEGRLALVAGGEAQSSLEALAKSETDGGWSREPGGFARFPREVAGTERMWELGLVAPIRIYPLFENRLRHDLGQTFAQAQDWSGRMYAAFSEVAADNDAAWDPEPRTSAQVTTVTAANRMICFPYPLRMNANNRVDQAAAILLATADEAARLGVPVHRQVQVVSAAAAADSQDVLDRPGYGASPGLRAALDRALEQARVEARDLDLLDLYSCFPVVPKLAALHLDAVERPLSVTGGLSSFGGAHNDYSSHAVVAMTRALRAAGDGSSTRRTGLVYANGEYLTEHAAVVLASVSDGRPPCITSADDPGLATTVAEPAAPRYVEEYVGTAEIETYTVEYDREGGYARAWVVARTPDGDRTAARVSTADTATLDLLTASDAEPVGRSGWIVRDEDRRRFTLDGSDRS